MGVNGVTLPDDPIQSQPTLAAARTAFEALPPVRVLFDNGAGAATGAPVAGFEQSFARWPVPGTHARSWYLGAAGALTDGKPPAAGSDAFTWNQSARPATDFSGSNTGAGGLWTATPAYDWTQNPAGTSVSYVSAPLTANTVVIGAGSLRAWVKSSAQGRRPAGDGLRGPA